MNVKDTFKRAGISQRELAEMLGCSEPYVNRVLNGKQKVSKKIRERLIKATKHIRAYQIFGERILR